MRASGLLRAKVRHGIRWVLVRGWFPSRRFVYRTRESEGLAVLMCLWNRRDRLIDVLRALDDQTGVSGVRLYLWNNNRKDHAYYLNVLAHFGARTDGALVDVQIVKSPHNIGSIARFYWGRRLHLREGEQPLVVIDDDEDFTQQFLRETASQYEPNAALGWWAWRSRSDYYWDREAAAPGESVDHIGPGGSVFSSRILADPHFFTTIPDRFRMLDDLWFSWWVPRTGRRLGKLDVEMAFVSSENDQHWGQADSKQEFFTYLREENISPSAS